MKKALITLLIVGAFCINSPMKATAAQDSGAAERFSTEGVTYDTGIPGVTLEASGQLFYEVSHQGSGQGKMEISGNATGDYEVYVEIVKSGVIGEAVYRLSLDGGKTFLGQDVVAESCKIGGTGLKLMFSVEQDNMEFLAGEVYTASLPETFPVTASKYREANVIVAGHPMKDHELTVTVLSSGRLGEAKFSVSTGEQWADAAVLPVSGVYELEDGIRLIFSDAEYEKGLIYSAAVASNDETVNYIPLYILIGAVMVAVVCVLSVLAGKKEKETDYKLHVYRGKRTV